MLTAEIIAIGSELLTPERADTNSLWLTEKLNQLGIEVKLKTIVGDDDARLEGAIRDALKRSRVVIATGGLGPTEDDITRKAAARALGRRLILDDRVLEAIRERFNRLGREMPEINARQAMVIEGAEVLPNPHGTAPGLYVEHEGRSVILLPGPPREMQPMFETYVRPKLEARAGNTRVVRRILRVVGLGESAVDERIAPVYTRYKNPTTTILFNRAEVEIHLTARAATEREAELLLDGLAGQLEERLGDAIFAFRGETMEEVVGLRLAVGGYTLAVAESCTGGLIAQRLTDVPGASAYFIEGVVAYSNEAKIRTLGVPRELIERCGAVSAPVAEAMAEGVRRRAGTDFGLAVTGIAGPSGGTEDKPVGLVFVALADDAHTEHRRLMLTGDRQLIRWRASQAALDLLRRRLI
ncbi:competence/damage-inducible protein A [Pyrinomonas methylaliphatogenes]|uniref:CinA-like protein n=1 Tax=Pyrinomonas methylaliphatogenes TaxID=454194 RepID=A0A0B6WXW4_9BACT|nr:competence/damage-inducible protein A [Pyrinomonas methylaliphatogenes]CDM65966.1 competence/damage-inducible protein cinA [Pyrinomonas methylaliphatogenes]